VEQLAGGQLKKIEKPILSENQIYRAGEERFYLANGNNRLGSLLIKLEFKNRRNNCK
jgi:hypothetical protein